MCSIVRIKSRLSTESQYVTLWSGAADPECEAYHALRRMYRTFEPQLCEHPHLIDTVRLELDTRAVTDWNEIDYVRLVGSTDLPTAILPNGASGVIYEPSRANQEHCIHLLRNLARRYAAAVHPLAHGMP
jgi:hypothetical protein